MGGHEIDRLWRDQCGCADEIAFVLPILIVSDDDHLAPPDRLDRVVDRVEFHVAGLVGFLSHRCPK